MPIRVLLVEDSTVALIILKRILSISPDLCIVGTAQTGKEALTLVPTLQPDVICTDFHMPQMNGLEFIQEVMVLYPRPILVISASVQTDDTHNVFQLLNAGAVDVFPKPKTGLASDYELIGQELIQKIKVLSGVKVFTKHRKSQQTLNPLPLNNRLSIPPAPSPLPVTRTIGSSPTSISNWTDTPKVPFVSSKIIKMLAIGASTGGPQALHTILTQLPSNFPVPVVCVQHISEGFLQGLVTWLDGECHLSIKIATPGELPHAGCVYFAPEGHHLEFSRNGRFAYSTAPPLAGHRPSVTTTLESVAQFYGSNSAGILLTGMGRDGADGMKAIAEVGGLTIAQNQDSCVVFGMPAEAIALGAAQYILSVNEIAPFLLNRVKGLS
ncbi:Chemotaxis response regulator protein-glutamate methylesterase 2 [Planktothrix tepida]|uniref:Protein-glutamate methylesterase/protein-glutamine glutaminase n=2 Tax=Planktothrix TaxID=54304 RepID=A0A1J1LKX3_9CYAN|nr:MULTISPECIES: chemotaxis-specific protein-glutamate methyltransferase CheB [Planktothrix]CAD5940914.1 Chemotaxis response regulator protein-glutamate methylesterase 2 [Planktothrix tepida]CAD5970531.1 Chemotaxis response regulator protein-glutamate methylesterase 2 [Planktothrix pseudagardhii]CUR33123.1 Chemotaxis response regulator protein-glutamate methylesterase [Planktothrix tepida PCC 9214]